MHRYVLLLFSHPGHEKRGPLWLGHWPPPLRQEFGTFLLPLSLREGQAALLRIGARVTQAFLALWDSYGEALTVATPPPPDIDFSADLPPPSPLDSLLTQPPESPPSQLAASPWTTRLDADHG